jgi:hypothetical protein
MQSRCGSALIEADIEGIKPQSVPNMRHWSFNILLDAADVAATALDRRNGVRMTGKETGARLTVSAKVQAAEGSVFSM